MTMVSEKVTVPLDVPRNQRQDYIQNYLKITRNSGRLMLSSRRSEG